MSQWVKLCDVSDAPAEGKVVEVEAGGIEICLARVNGTLTALDNWCPHRRGPLGQGWIEGGAVICPWHSWAFDVVTGFAEYPEKEKVDVFPLRQDGTEVMVNIE